MGKKVGRINELNEVDNTSDANKSVSTAQQTALDLKLNLTGGELSGNITMLGSQTVDGRDVSVDGAKLDLIEDSAKDDQTASEVPIVDGGALITAIEVEGALAENRTAINLNTSKVTNVSTDLSEGTSTVTTVDVNSSDGANATLLAASTIRAGVLTKVKYDEIVANTSKLSGIEANAEINNISDVNATDLTDGGDSVIHFHNADRARANHTGTQVASTISDFDVEVGNNSAVSANTSHRPLTTGIHGVGSDYLAKTSKSNQIGEFAATIVVGRSGNVDYLCDGVADDVQIQAALDEAMATNNGTVYLKEGDYVTVAELQNISNVNLCGSGVGTVITPATDFNILDITGSNVEISGIKFNGAGRSKGSGITIGLLNSVANVSIKGVIFFELKDSAIESKLWYDSSNYNVYIAECGSVTNAAIHLGSTITGGTNNVTFHGGQVSGSNGVNIHIEGNSEAVSNCRRIKFIGTQIHGILPTPSPYSGVVIDGIAYDNIFSMCNCNAHGSNGFEIVSGHRNTIDVCTIQGHDGNNDILITSGNGTNISKCSFIDNDTLAINDNGGYTVIKNNTFLNIVNGVSINLRAQATGNIFQTGSGTMVLCNSGAYGAQINSNQFIVGSPAIDLNNVVQCQVLGNSFVSSITNKIVNIGTDSMAVNNLNFNPIGNFTAPSIPATTVNYTNTYGYPCMVTIFGGVVTDIVIDSVSTGLTTGSFIIEIGETISITYSSAPTWKWWGR